jgi:hypothetical protein
MKTVAINDIIKKTKDRRIRRFILFAHDLLGKRGFKIKFLKAKTLRMSKDDANNKSTGYFSEAEKTIVIAVNRPFKKWFDNIFVHEFGHFVQYILKTPASVACDKEQSLHKVYEWIDGEIELSKSELRHHFAVVKNMERECEKIALKLISLFDLPINKKKYWRGTIRYLKTYDFSRRKRRWKPINW